MTGPLDWSRYRLAQIWEMLRNEPTEIGDRQAVAWDNTARLCEDQADQLDRAAAQLAESWVPTAGTAAEAFQAVLRTLTDAMRRSAEAARTNQAAISDITHQMSSTRERIAHLMAQSHTFEHAEQAGSPPYVLPGRVPPPARPQGDATPPFGWRASLDQQAREVMAHMEAMVVLRANGVQVEPPLAIGADAWTAKPVGVAPEAPAIAGGVAGSGMPLPIPGFMGGPIGPPIMSPPVVDDESGGQSPNGVDAPDTAVPVLDGNPTTGSTAVGQDTAPPIVGSMIQTPIGTALRPGGLIGGIPTPGVQQPGGSGMSSARPPARTGTAGRAGLAEGPMTPVLPPAGQLRPSSSSTHIPSAGGRRRRGIQDRWDVPRGVPAVLEPPPEPTEHDPGPGVIGIDR